MKPFLLSHTLAPRQAFTIAEVTVALAVLAVVMTLVAQLGVQALRERERVISGQTAQETAANILELARACPWEKLTADWAREQKLPEPYPERGWKLKVQVEPEPSRPGVKRVSVTVNWVSADGTPGRPAQVVSLFANRTREEKP